MLLRIVTSVLAFSYAAASFATEPGTPMDCSDLELAPGLTCTTLIRTSRDVSFYVSGGNGSFAVDHAGNPYIAGYVEADTEPIGTCGTAQLFRRPLLRIRDGDAWRTLVASRDRCAELTREGVGRVTHLHFDPHGSLFVRFGNFCAPPNPPAGCPDFIDLANGPWLARIDGFTPLSDVLPRPLALCSNDLDDDGDGRIDAADDHRKSAVDNDESRP